MDLRNKTALVTGAARGIGREIALALAKEGVRVAAADIAAVDGPEFGELLREAGRERLEILPLQADVAARAAAEEMVKKTLERFGGLDILVNAAGVISVSPVLDLEEKEWDRVLNVNLKGVFLCCRAALPHLIKRGEGRIVNVASVAGKAGRPGLAHYSASKHGVQGFTKSLAYEVAAHNITVNAVNPGIVDTPMWSEILAPHFGKQRGADPKEVFAAIIRERIPLGRPQTLDDIARAVLFLLRSPNITGCSLTVDGGYTML